MSDRPDSFLHLVTPYGLSEEEGKIYLFLLRRGFATALALSRQLTMGRTKVYRILDKLRAKQLVEFKVDERGMKFGATHPQKFQQLISDREQEVATLKQSLPDLVAQLTGLSATPDRQSKVLYYEGIEGLKQVSYNLTTAKGMARVFEMEHMSDFLPRPFAENVRKELVANKIFTRDLTNKPAFPGYTNVTELISDFAETRYIDPKKLSINFEVLIYNNVYATYTYKDDQIFCVEIYNDQLAAMQKQIFDFIWEQARSMKFLDDHGAAKVMK